MTKGVPETDKQVLSLGYILYLFKVDFTVCWEMRNMKMKTIA